MSNLHSCHYDHFIHRCIEQALQWLVKEADWLTDCHFFLSMGLLKASSTMDAIWRVFTNTFTFCAHYERSIQVSFPRCVLISIPILFYQVPEHRAKHLSTMIRVSPHLWPSVSIEKVGNQLFLKVLSSVCIFLYHCPETLCNAAAIYSSLSQHIVLLSVNQDWASSSSFNW